MRSTSSSTAICTSGTQVRRTGSLAPRSTRRAGSSASTPTRASARPTRTGPSSTSRSTQSRTSRRTSSSEGHVDVAVFQSTYLKEWYTKGFNDIDQNASILDRFPGKLILNGRWDPREGEAGLRQLEADHAKYGIKGVKLYTAEWYKGSRGWKLTDPEAVPFLDKCVELGIKNIHVHKGPTIWPLDKDAFDVSDIDHVATDYQDLNFIIEHVGLPRIEDFCFMATQERNVYAGLAVVIGGLMHARPKFFAKVMGELLFWVGEDKMLFGSDYAIWEPKWQVEGFVDWEMPDDSELRGLPAPRGRGQEEDPGPQRRQAVRRRGAGGAAGAGARRRAGQAGGRATGRRARVTLRSRVIEALGTVYDPELDEPITTLGFVGSCVVTDDGDVEVRLRLPTPQCAPNFAFLMAADARSAVRRLPEVREVAVVLEDHYTGAEINAALGRGDDFAGAFPGETAGELDTLRRLFQRKALVAREGRLLATVDDPATATLGELSGPDAERCRELRRVLGMDASDHAPAFVKGDGIAVSADEVARFKRFAGLTALSLETNGGICRDLLRVRYEEEGVAA